MGSILFIVYASLIVASLIGTNECTILIFPESSFNINLVFADQGEGILVIIPASSSARIDSFFLGV